MHSNKNRKISSIPLNSTIRFQWNGKFLEGTKHDESNGKVKVYVLSVLSSLRGEFVKLPADEEVELLEAGRTTLELG